MLGYKTWCETRLRFAIAAAALGLVCVLVIAFPGDWRHPAGATFSGYVWGAAYNDSVKTLFILLAIILGGGSLRQEQALGTVGFTLGLPVSRLQLLAARAGVGMTQVLILAALVGILVPFLARLAGNDYPAAQSLGFAALWGVCGILLFSVALLASTIVASETVAWLVSFLTVMGYEAAVNLTGLRRHPIFDLYRIMSGDGQAYFDAHEHLLLALPWHVLAGGLAVSAVLLGLAHLFARRRDF